MSSAFTSSTPSPAPLDRAAIARAEPRVQRAAHWFFWIAGLSVVNSVGVHTGHSINFVIGLGFTQIIDAIFKDWKLLAAIFDIGVLGFFVAMALFAKRGQTWAFVLGGVVYLIDAVVFAVVQEWMSVGFHAFALFGIFGGPGALRQAVKRAEAARVSPLVAAAPPPLLPSTEAPGRPASELP